MANVLLKDIRKVYPHIEQKPKKKGLFGKKEEVVEEKKKINLQITDEGVVAVQQFNLDIKDKEFIVLVGPSGCGKSTTLRMIAGLEEITDGELYIDDNLVNDVAPKDRDIAMVFQSYALYPHMTVYDNMAYSLKLKKLPKDVIDKKVKEAAEILDITQYLKRKPKNLSGGQRQRVAIGRAIVREPKLLLMDEPLSNLDAKLRNQMRAEIIKLRKKINTTFVYVTHDQTEAMTLADRIVIMKDGYVQQIGTPKEVYSDPANKFVGGFIGSPAMNFIKGKVNGDGLFIADDLESSFETKFSIKLNKDHVKLLKEHIGESIYLGIRPEDIYLENDKVERSLSSSISLGLDFMEILGREFILYTFGSGQRIIVKTMQEIDNKSSKKVNVKIDLEKLYFFSTKDEMRIR